MSLAVLDEKRERHCSHWPRRIAQAAVPRAVIYEAGRALGVIPSLGREHVGVRSYRGKRVFTLVRIMGLPINQYGFS
jgi:hypothetical protein